MIMADNAKPSDVMRSMMEKNLQQAQGAMASYFDLLEKSTSASPFSATDQAKAFKQLINRNVAATFDYSDKLLHARNLQDVMRVQAEFLQAQFQALTEQAKDVAEATAPAVGAPME
jgi:hypothetical protein